VNDSDVQGGYTGAGNLNADPLFINAVALAYDLQNGSPCIDTGTVCGVTHDCLGEPRPYGSAPDLGAYELVPEPGMLLACLLVTMGSARRRPL
jgi:hypothetical protein